jgi:hypothetical protein
VRGAHAALRLGTRSGEGASADVLVYRMSDGAETIHVALNRSEAATSSLPGLPAGDYRDLVSDADVSVGTTPLPARSAWILVPR